jgi:enoyl-CoA hydratase
LSWPSTLYLFPENLENTTVPETIEVEIKDHVAILTLNRPKALNAIDQQMMQELHDAFDELDRQEEICVLVLRGAGRAFCAGMDIKWSDSLTPKDRVEQGRIGQKLVAHIEQMGKPVVAAIHGYALGGGLELALGADFIVCHEDAQLGFPEITLSARPPYRPKIAEDGDPDQPEFGGSVANWGALKRLPERVGKAVAKELMMTGVRIDAQRALKIGLVNHVYQGEEFDEQVSELANRIGAMNHYNLRLIKELINHGYDFLESHAR